MTVAQLRGYLFEVFISKMLNNNGFKQCEFNNGNYLNQSPCELVSQDGEIQGRGTKHQIDYVGIYERNIPFVYPIRILVECKYYKKGVFKNTIREFIGVYKDIEENYFYHQREERVRFLNIPIIFSATFFNDEAINLAWAHGINLVSYHKIPLLQNYLNQIDQFLERNCMGNYLDKKKAKNLKKQFKNEAKIPNFKTFLFATTKKGLLINLISDEKFPDDLFVNENEQECGIFLDDNEILNKRNERSQRIFHIILYNDKNRRRFYFQANTNLLRKEFPELSLNERINEKMRYFRELTIIKKIQGLDRIIKLKANFEFEKIKDITK